MSHLLDIDYGVVDERNTAEIRKMKKLRSRNNGSLVSAIESAGRYARRDGKTAFVYCGNSFMHIVWRVSFNKHEYLSPIGNTGNSVYSVSPDLTIRRHSVLESSRQG